VRYDPADHGRTRVPGPMNASRPHVGRVEDRANRRNDRDVIETPRNSSRRARAPAANVSAVDGGKSSEPNREEHDVAIAAPGALPRRNERVESTIRMSAPRALRSRRADRGVRGTRITSPKVVTIAWCPRRARALRRCDPIGSTQTGQPDRERARGSAGAIGEREAINRRACDRRTPP